jgi:hypothetical protein
MPTGRTKKAYMALAAYLPNLPEAACRSHPNPDLWHPERPSPAQEKEAIEVCRTCAAHDACLLFAIRAHPISGIWGGTTAFTRESMLVPRRTKVGA